VGRGFLPALPFVFLTHSPAFFPLTLLTSSLSPLLKFLLSLFWLLESHRRLLHLVLLVVSFIPLNCGHILRGVKCRYSRKNVSLIMAKSRC